jgi:hypothetical protein
MLSSRSGFWLPSLFQLKDPITGESDKFPPVKRLPRIDSKTYNILYMVLNIPIEKSRNAAV